MSYTKALEERVAMRDKTKTFSDRLQALEESIEGIKNAQMSLVEAINTQLGSHPKRVATIEEVLEAVVGLSGFNFDALNAKIAENRDELKKRQSEVDKENVRHSVEKGYLKAVEQIDAGGLAVGTEVDKEGRYIGEDARKRPVYEGRIELDFDNLTDEIKALFKGKRVGDVVETPGGGKFTINEVYHFDAEAMKKDMEATQAATQAVVEEAAAVTATSDAEGAGAPV
jgi:hypothetical protein